MFSPDNKTFLSSAIEYLLLNLHHPEMPTERPRFYLHVDGGESWSWADIDPNWAIKDFKDGKIASSRVTQFGLESQEMQARERLIAAIDEYQSECETPAPDLILRRQRRTELFEARKAYLQFRKAIIVR